MAAAHSDCCFFAPCTNILTYLLTYLLNYVAYVGIIKIVKKRVKNFTNVKKTFSNL